MRSNFFSTKEKGSINMEYGEIVKIEQQKKCAEKFPCRNQMTDLPVAQSVINNNRLKL